jgi:hypothetical protein
MKVPAPIFIGVIPPTSRDATSGQAATHSLSMKCCLGMSRDPDLIAASFLWNKALVSHSSITSVAFYPSDLQLVADPGS